MTAILASVTEIFTAAIGWVGDVGTAVTAEPILLLYVVVPLVGLGVGLFRRLLNVN